MDNYAFYQGKTLRESKVMISCRDLGLLRGYGVFDFMTASGTKIHLFSEHYNRLLNSAKNYNLKLPYSKIEIKKLVEGLLAKNGFFKSSIRIVLTGGVSANGRTVDKETFLILVDKLVPYPIKYYNQGVKVITREFRRDNPRIKALNYQFAYSIYQTQNIKDAFEIVYVSEDKVLEGATSNIFIVKNDTVITPKSDILPGITRNKVIELAKYNGLALEEREISKKELFEADEVFLTATTKRVMPVSHIDGIKIKESPGPITKGLMKLYEAI